MFGVGHIVRFSLISVENLFFWRQYDEKCSMHVNCLKNIDHANYSLTLDDFKIETPQPHMSTAAHKIKNSINIADPLQKWLHKYMLPNMKGRVYTFLVRMIHTRIPGQPRELA